MRAIAILTPVLLAVFAGCDRTGVKTLDELSWGPPVEASAEDMKQRAIFVLIREFKLGLDPDRTDEKEGEFWTVWEYKMSPLYMKSKRARAHVKIEEVEEGKIRIGVSVVEQRNDNIDNPNLVEEARWVQTKRDGDRASRIEQNIARRYLKVKPSKYWEEKHRDTPRTSMRPDLVDKNKDVDLEELSRPDAPGKEPPDSDE